jgi:hypothetical protein
MTDLRVRRSVDDLSQLDLARLRRAFQSMMDAEGEDSYQRWAGIHGFPMPIYSHHGIPSFLAWNRIYLVRFEEVLLSYEPGVALPWWDWTRGDGIPAAFATPEVDGRSNPLYSSPIHSSEWEEGYEPVPERTSRQPRPPANLPTAAEVEAILGKADFEDFAEHLELLHDSLHNWVGGTNGSVALSSYDPFSWAYQASIDRIWVLWQARNPEAPPRRARIGDRRLAPFEVAEAEAWDTAKLGYEYAGAAPQSAAVFAAGASGDRPSVTDHLNFSDYAQAFAEIIASEDTEPPLTIGIYGSWGIGKSSLLDMIADQFEDPEAGPTPVHVVRFNAWEYNSSERIWPSLVRRVMEEMEQQAQWSPWARAWDTLKRNAKREWRRRRAPLAVAVISLLVVAVVAAFELDFSPALILTALGALGISGLAKLISDVARNPVSRWVTKLVEGDAYGEELPYMREIRDDLAFLAKQMGTDGTQPRILLTIDDLDRCEPEKAVEVLQAVNQLLDFEAFVICLGIDARIITAAVAAHYGKLLGEAGASGYEYLDKIVQIPFRIPTPASADIEKFLTAQMPVRTGLAEAPDEEATVEEAIAQVDGDFAEPGDRDGEATVGTPPPVVEAPVTAAMQFEQAELDGFLELSPFIRSNPRHIKRLINVYRMVRTLALRRGVDEILEDSSHAIAWIVICAQWPYSVGGMLRAMRPHVELFDAGEPFPDGDPLRVLHAEFDKVLDEDLRRQLDDDPELLEDMLGRTTISWEKLRVLQAYTLNFNPAIEDALLRGAHAGNGQPSASET